MKTKLASIAALLDQRDFDGAFGALADLYDAVCETPHERDELLAWCIRPGR